MTQISASGLSTISYAYDELSRRTSMTDGTGTTTYSYDRMRRLTQAAQPNGTLAYSYDLDSNRTTLTYPGSNAVTYTFSNAGRLSSLQDWGSRTTSYTYTPAGLAATATPPNGLVTTYTYDRAQRLTALTNVVGSTTITSHAYTLDSEGNRTAQTEFVSGITTGTSDSFGYTYDGLNRLTAVTTTNAESFTLDSAANISSRSGPSATYSYDTSNRLTGDGSQTFTWSNADRLTGRGSDSFGYDPLDRLTSSTVSGTSRTYAYNADGLLQSRTQSGSTTNFLWDAATSPSRLLQVGSDKIVYGLGPLYIVSGSATTTLVRDGGKSVRAELNGSGAVNASFRYKAYGAIGQSNGASTPSYLGYAGELLDPSAFYYLRARWYDPATGRFVTKDPLAGGAASPITLNTFAYAADNPVGFLDPSGQRSSTDNDYGGACDMACVDRVADKNPCRQATGPCTYYIHDSPRGKVVELRNNSNDFLGLLTGVIGFVFHNGRWENTMTWSDDLIVSTTNVLAADPVIPHELGHTIQSAAMNDLYLPGYVSLITFDHKTHLMERDANRRANLPLDWNGDPVPADWHNPYHFVISGSR